MSEENILNLQNHIKENIDVYRERIKEEHTSRSGFISFTSNNIDEWDEQTDGFRDFEVKSGKYYLGFLLGVYCDIEGIKEDDPEMLRGNCLVPFLFCPSLHYTTDKLYLWLMCCYS